MILTKAILLEAEKWLGCKEESKNRSACVDEISRLYNDKVSSDAWCAKFVWAITNEACKKLNVDNPLKQTASTATMLSEAKKTLRTDNIAGKGSIFYTTRTGGGHVGFVTKVKDNLFDTIEGNTSSDSGEGDGVWAKTRDTTKKDYTFIHLEDLDTIENNLIAPFALDVAVADPRTYIGSSLFAIVGVGGFLLWRHKKKNKK
jgi:hypothetical protein